jgi:prepilin-type N-terminal cleavage/methylation domain-containing protein
MAELPMMNRKTQLNTAGFTLIELLVVIAIIALLAGLLFPVLSSSLNSGRTAASLSNLKQIHMLFVNYTTDKNGEYPISIENPDLFWRRVVWEGNYGPFAGGPVEVMNAMQSSEYSKIMWCPVMVSRFGQEQHPGGRGSYSLNKYFAPPSWGGGYRYEGEATMIGVKEPYLMGGSVLESNPKFGTFEHVESSEFPYDTAWMNLSYTYGGSREGALGLFVDGHVEMIARQQGVDMNASLKDIATLE